MPVPLNEIHNCIRKVLLEVWDPIGVGDNSALSDEYDSYISRLHALTSLPDAVELVEQKLQEIENALGMTCKNYLRHLAAMKIVATVQA
jgi:hypothetical protein